MRCFWWVMFLGMLVTAVACAADRPADIRYYPGDAAIVLELRGAGTPHDMRSVVLHEIAIVNGDGGPVRVGSVSIALWDDDRLVQMQEIGEAELVSQAGKWHARQAEGLLTALDPILRTSQFIDGVTLAPSPTLGPGEGLLITQQLCVFRGEADRIVVTAKTADGREFAAREIGLRKHRSPNKYRFPLDGRWFVAAAPSLHSHHRWAPIQEFAIDIVRLGEGSSTHRSDGTDVSTYFAFGAPVLSAADGKVVAVADGLADEVSLRKPDESAEAFAARSAAMQGELLKSGIGAVIGNHVIVEHGKGEFGYYAHLKRGSIEVEVGDTVEAGQRMAALGNSGNSTQPHLHFHIADGPDPTLARSLPVTFEGIAVEEDLDGGSGVLESGYLIDAGPLTD